MNSMDSINNKMGIFQLQEQEAVPGETDEQQLLRLAREMCDAFISGDPSHSFLSKHVARDFRGWHDLSATSMTVPEYQLLIQEIRLLYGNRKFEILDEQVHFEDGDRDQATVFQSVQYLVTSESLVRNALRTFRWKRQHGVWLCFEQATFKSDALFSGNMAPCF